MGNYVDPVYVVHVAVAIVVNSVAGNLRAVDPQVVHQVFVGEPRAADQNDVSLRLGQVIECLPRTEVTSDNIGGGREDEQRFEQTAKCDVILDNCHFDLHGVPLPNN